MNRKARQPVRPLKVRDQHLNEIYNCLQDTIAIEHAAAVTATESLAENMQIEIDRKRLQLRRLVADFVQRPPHAMLTDIILNDQERAAVFKLTKIVQQHLEVGNRKKVSEALEASLIAATDEFVAAFHVRELPWDDDDDAEDAPIWKPRKYKITDPEIKGYDPNAESDSEESDLRLEDVPLPRRDIVKRDPEAELLQSMAHDRPGEDYVAEDGDESVSDDAQCNDQI